MNNLEESKENIIEIIKELKETYENYRTQHTEEELKTWIENFKIKHKIRELPIDIHFYKAYGSGPAELEKMNIIYTDRSNKLYLNSNKRTSGGYYIIIHDLHKEKVNVKIDFSEELLRQWYGQDEVKKIVEQEIYFKSVNDLKNKGTSFKYINSNENSYSVEVTNILSEYIKELKDVINNYPKIMEEYLNEYKNLEDKYGILFRKHYEERKEKKPIKQGKLFTKYVWTLIYNNYKKEPNITEIEIKDDTQDNTSNINKKYNFMNDKEFKKIVKLLKYKKNIILEGVPGVGKTYIARKIASEITLNQENNVKIIQFHQSYAYEDFVQGLRPTDNNTFEPVDGILKIICDKAKEDIRNKIDSKYVLIIDEINRGNISKIFGETFMLIEESKRITKEQILKKENSKYAVSLPYSKNKEEKFDIPENVYFIGTMNTMDKSIALMDYALRRRFAIYEINPCFEDKESSDNFEVYLNDINNNNLRILVEKIKSINNSKNLDEIKFGHSYFCELNKDKDLKIDINEKIDFIINYEIIPQLKEYLLGDNKKIKKISEFLQIDNIQNRSIDSFF